MARSCGAPGGDSKAMICGELHAGIGRQSQALLATWIPFHNFLTRSSGLCRLSHSANQQRVRENRTNKSKVIQVAYRRRNREYGYLLANTANLCHEDTHKLRKDHREDQSFAGTP